MPSHRLRAAMLVAILALAAVACETTGEKTVKSTEPVLIPRSAIFGNPERTSPQLSPDGKKIAFLAPKDGVLNIWVAPSSDISKAKPITSETARPILNYFWARTSDLVLYMQDKGGNENFLLYSANPDTGETKNLTPLENTRVMPIATSIQHPDEILVGLNDRDPQWHDVWMLNVKTGERTLVYQNTAGLSSFVADDDLKLRLASKDQPDGGYLVQTFGQTLATSNKLSPFTLIPGDDALTTGLLGFDTSGSTLYGLDSRGRDKAALVTFSLVTGKPTVIAKSDVADIGSVIVDPLSGKVQGYGIDYLKNTWTALDPAIADDIAFLNSSASGQWQIVSRSDDGTKWLVLHDPVTEPAYYWLYERPSKTLTKLFTVRPKLEGAPLSPMYPQEIKSRDGLTLVSYLTLPRSADADGDGKPDAGPLPMVLDVHGGPWGRDHYGYNGEHQWLANRGYAVLSVNFRASTGFGKSFTNAGDREWGRKMQDDLDDAVAWAVNNGIADKERIAIMGGSYGGYATLAGVTMTPKQYACGVDIVGPSNLVTLLGSVPPYWASFYQTLTRRVGDPRTEEGLALLRERSPLTYADKIERPLLIAQGANDPRVKQAESDQIVGAMMAKSIPVTYVLYPNEGHGFANAANRTSFYAVAEAFLSKCLGGRFEPVGNDFKGSSITVPEGDAEVPGLTAALKSK